MPSNCAQNKPTLKAVVFRFRERDAAAASHEMVRRFMSACPIELDVNLRDDGTIEVRGKGLLHPSLMRLIRDACHTADETQQA